MKKKFLMGVSAAATLLLSQNTVAKQVDQDKDVFESFENKSLMMESSNNILMFAGHSSHSSHSSHGSHGSHSSHSSGW